MLLPSTSVLVPPPPTSPLMLEPARSSRLLVPPVKTMALPPEIVPELMIARFCPAMPTPVFPAGPMPVKPPPSPGAPDDPPEIVPLLVRRRQGRW